MPLVELAAVTVLAPFLHLLAGLLEDADDGARTTSQSFIRLAYALYIVLGVAGPALAGVL